MFASLDKTTARGRRKRARAMEFAVDQTNTTSDSFNSKMTHARLKQEEDE
jgi:hypothetical protein